MQKKERHDIGEALIRLGILNEAQLGSAKEAQRMMPMPLASVLVQLGYVNEELVLSVIADLYGVRPWSIDQSPPTPEALVAVTPEMCRRHSILPVAIDSDTITLAMADPDDVEAIDMVRYATRLRVEPVVVSTAKLLQAIERYHGDQAEFRTVDELVRSAEVDKELADHAPTGEEDEEADATPIIGLVNQIIHDAIREQASDIHFEPRAGRLEVRFRVDGQLKKVREIPRTIQSMIIARLKIISDLDISESRLPQDGRAQTRFDGRQIDLRVSIIPGHHGQRIVIRILDRFASIRRLDQVGFTEHNLALFREMITSPHGVLLVTGPTGSGKTTTLYGAIAELKDETSNIMTVEDPVEYEIDGVSQTQINEKIGLSFARQLRTMLRQDPDVILVGEIRDNETADTAIRAALTGHLVLSTLHSNDAVSSIPRLLDMGIDPFMLGTSLIGVVSQRLVRVLCIACMGSRKATPAEQAIWTASGKKPPARLAIGVGCPLCGGSGYKARIAIHEILPVMGPVGELISNRASVQQVRAEALKWGFQPIEEHALQLIEEGVTSFDEARKKVRFVTVARS